MRAMGPPLTLVQTAGSGPPLLVVHGTGVAHSPSLTASLRRHFCVTTYDRRGTPRWPRRRDEPIPSVGDHADDAAAVIARISDGSPIHVLGISFGGVIVLDLLLRRPALVMTAAVFEPPYAPGDPHRAAAGRLLEQFRLRRRAHGSQRACHEFYRRTMAADEWQCLAMTCRESMQAMASHLYCDLHANACYRPAELTMSAISTRLLLLHGGRSHPRFAAAVAALRVCLPSSTTARISSAAHVLDDAGGEELAAALATFSARGERPAAQAC